MLIRVIIVISIVAIFFASRCGRSRSDSVSLFALKYRSTVIEFTCESHLARVM
jgi:hypothetical protein